MKPAGSATRFGSARCRDIRDGSVRARAPARAAHGRRVREKSRVTWTWTRFSRESDDSKGTPEIGRQNPVRATEARVRRVWVRWRGVCAPWISPRNVTERPPSARRSLDVRPRWRILRLFRGEFSLAKTHRLRASDRNPDPNRERECCCSEFGLGFVDLHLVCFPVESDTR